MSGQMRDGPRPVLTDQPFFSYLILCFFFLFVYLKCTVTRERMRNRKEREIFDLSVLFPNGRNSQGCNRLQAGDRNSIRVSRVGCRGSRTWSTTFSFVRNLSRAASLNQHAHLAFHFEGRGLTCCAPALASEPLVSVHWFLRIIHVSANPRA